MVDALTMRFARKHLNESDWREFRRNAARHERQRQQDIEIAQRAVDRVALYQPVYPLPAHAARLESYAFVLGYMAHQ